MIKELSITDLDIINTFLKQYNMITYEYDSVRENSFIKFTAIYDKKNIAGILIYSIYYDRIEIDNIVIDENKRRNGLASKLIEFLIIECKKNNYKNITLEVNVNNEAAIYLYKKFGFEIVAKREKYYGSSDAYLMIRGIL